MKYLYSVEFWVITVLLSIVLNVIANFIYRRIENVPGKILNYWIGINKKRKSQWNDLLLALSSSADDRAYIYSVMSILFLRSIFLLMCSMFLFGLGMLFIYIKANPIVLALNFLIAFSANAISLWDFLRVFRFHRAVNQAREQLGQQVD